MARILLLRSLGEATVSQGLLLSLLKNGHYVTWDREDAFPAYRNASFDVAFIPSGGYASYAIAALVRVPLLVVMQRNHILHALAEIIHSNYFDAGGERRIVIWGLDPVQTAAFAAVMPHVPVIQNPLPFAGRFILQPQDGARYDPGDYSIKGQKTANVSQAWQAQFGRYVDSYVFLGSPPADDVEINYSHLGLNRRIASKDLPLSPALRRVMQAAAMWIPDGPLSQADETASLGAAMRALIGDEIPNKTEALSLLLYAGYWRHLLLCRRRDVVEALQAADGAGRFVALGPGWHNQAEPVASGLIRNRMKLYAVTGCVVDLGSTSFAARWYNRPYEVAQFGNALLQLSDPAPSTTVEPEGCACHRFASVEEFVDRLADLEALQGSWMAATGKLESDRATGAEGNGRDLIECLEALHP